MFGSPKKDMNLKSRDISQLYSPLLHYLLFPFLLHLIIKSALTGIHPTFNHEVCFKISKIEQISVCVEGGCFLDRFILF